MSKISKSKSASQGAGCGEPLEAVDTVAPSNQIEALAVAETDGETPSDTDTDNQEKGTPKKKLAKTKSDLILGHLKRKSGGTIEELQEVTGWQAHSVRGFLSGTLRKKLGLTVTSTMTAKGIRRYRVAGQISR